MTSFALAKNVLTVGSIGQPTNGIFGTSNFSSYGPTDDGRIKPDLVGYGENVYSSVASSRSSYSRYTGTSMAAPNVAGSLALLQQLASETRGRPLVSASLRGLAIHTARDQGLPGPDYRYGWGILDTEAAALQLEASLQTPLRLQEDVLFQDSSFVYDIAIPEAGILKVTLVWTDPPALSTKLRMPACLTTKNQSSSMTLTFAFTS